MEYERAVSDAVEATIAEGLRQSSSTLEARGRAAAAWRDPLTFAAAEHLSRRLALQAVKGASSAVTPSTLRRALLPYAALVAAAAEAEMERSPDAFIAAD
jgi:hypothetical protein